MIFSKQCCTVKRMRELQRFLKLLVSNRTLTKESTAEIRVVATHCEQREQEVINRIMELSKEHCGCCSKEKEHAYG